VKLLTITKQESALIVQKKWRTKMKETRPVRKRSGKKEATPSELIQMAVSQGADLTQLRELLTLKQVWEKDEARKQYASEMVAVQQKIPLVAKTLKNPQTHSKYASLDAIICQTKEIYTAHGFSISFYEGDSGKDNQMRVCADIIHQLGHRESYYFDVPIENRGIKGNVNMTSIHAKASASSYGRRYLMCMIWNIPTGDDNDGNTTEAIIDDKQLSNIRDALAEIDASEKSLVDYLGVSSLEELPLKDYQKAMSAIQSRKARVNK
jgi:hypothetical protein